MPEDSMSPVLDNRNALAIEKALIEGDLSGLSPEQRLSYYKQVCESVGLNPLTKPFAYLRLNGKLTLYALRDATDQLRKVHKVSITNVSTQKVEDVFVVTATAKDVDGRTDSSTGAVAIGAAKGESLANLLMKAETKAKRRVTLSICGLGMMDETEDETEKGAAPFSDEEKQDYIAGKIANLSESTKAEGVEIRGVLAQEYETEQTFWYLIVTEDKQQIPVSSPKASDSGRLAGRVGSQVVLKGVPFEKEGKTAYALMDVVSVSKPTQKPSEAPRTPPSVKKGRSTEPTKVSEVVIDQKMNAQLHAAKNKSGMPDSEYRRILGFHGYEHGPEIRVIDFPVILKEISEYSLQVTHRDVNMDSEPA